VGGDGRILNPNKYPQFIMGVLLAQAKNGDEHVKGVIA
jgi:hypothetical protein